MDFNEMANEFMDRAAMAAGIFNQLNQQETDFIVEQVYKAGLNNRISLAKMAAEETKLGRWQDKVIKNVTGSLAVYDDIRQMKTVGVIKDDVAAGITEIAQPLGPIFAIIPMTNPTSTTLFKILICLKTRNPIIISSHRRAMTCVRKAAEICYEAALKAGAPDDCIQVITDHSRDLTHAIMSHHKLALILATGGTGLVSAAYSSGNPTIGVGPGNVPVYIDKSADIAFAIQQIIKSKTFDNGTICASEQSIIIEEAIAEDVKKEMIRHKCYLLSEYEMKKVEKIAVVAGTLSMNPEIVGQPVQEIARMAGITIPEDTCLLVGQPGGIGPEHPLSGEILAPVLALYICKNYNEAINMCIDLNYLGGIGHTAAIYANDEKRIMEYAEVMNAGRVVVNTPSSQGAVGGIYNTLNVSFTLGCGSGGKNITTENVSAQHLINIKRVTRRRPNIKWQNLSNEMLFDEAVDADTLYKEFHKNS
ncbi:MAG: aldehyde dehydrogenase family protein [Bacteroidales bacterium]|nr:aldehyde dehydrogenase family protein [Bacteroidales bacterium]